MSKKINTTSIGLFIVSGVALGVIGLLLFSSSKMFSKTKDIIVYFDDSLNGLNEGAPVKFRGVTIGSVKRVMVQFNQATNDYAMPVIIELEEKLLRERMPSFNYAFSEAGVAERIQAGLRATLQTESLVTGVLYVGMDIDPKAPPPVFHQLEKLYPEMPSEPTATQQLFAQPRQPRHQEPADEPERADHPPRHHGGRIEDGRHQRRPHQPAGLRKPAGHRPRHHQRPGRPPADA